MSAPIPGLPEDLTPTPRVALRTPAPAYYRGIYLTISTARTPALFRPLLARAREHGINALVVDVQPRLPSEEFMRLARESGFYLIARVVVFDGGLATFPPPQSHLDRVLTSAETAAQGGFAEIQLDYIRFADRATGMTLRRRYETVTGIIKLATDRLRPHGVRVGADVFGRIAFNREDRIGQKLEVFAPHLDVIYPMLYPSHFYGDPDRRRDPYGTIRDGVRGPIARVGRDVRIVAYIQSFQMRVSESGLSLEAYVRKQLEGARDGGSAGFVAWNARNDYRAFFRALAQYDRQAAR
jgi:hypothetical protein